MSAPDRPSRATWIAGTRRLLDILDAQPDLPPPFVGSKAITWNFYGNHKQLAAIEAMVGIPFTGAIDPQDDNYYVLSSELDGMPAEIRAMASFVAEKHVTGTRTVEDVEWVRLPAEDDTEGEQE